MSKTLPSSPVNYDLKVQLSELLERCCKWKTNHKYTLTREVTGSNKISGHITKESWSVRNTSIASNKSHKKAWEI